MQPWASLAVMGIKKIETRNWATAYRGPLFIHASKTKAGKVIAKKPSIAEHIPDFDALPMGAIIGQVTLVDIVTAAALPGFSEALTLEEQAFGAYAVKYCWLFTDPVMLEDPIPATGRLGLWEI